MIKYVIIIIVLFTLGSCETNYGIINTGLANGKFDGSMYEYFQANHYDWDSLVLMIDRAGLKDVFTPTEKPVIFISRVFICGMTFLKGPLRNPGIEKGE